MPPPGSDGPPCPHGIPAGLNVGIVPDRLRRKECHAAKVKADKRKALDDFKVKRAAEQAGATGLLEQAKP